MKTKSPVLAVTSALSFGLAAFVSAETRYESNIKYAPGDLVLTFQKIGSENTVYANIGNAATLFRGTASGAADAANRLNIIDLSTVLNTAFGSTWKDDTTIYVGAVGVQNDDSESQDLVNGDPSRTLYVSKPRNSVKTLGSADSSAWSLSTAGDTAFSAASNKIVASNNTLETREANSFTTIALTGDSQIDDQNPLNPSLNGIIQGTAYGVFSGGVQQVGSATSFGTFGAAGSVEFALDLYRILAVDNIAGQVSGTIKRGTYEGTITIGTNGQVSFITQAAVAATPFETWALTFPALDTSAKRLPTADPDNDGMNNLTEFVLNGNPGASDSSTVAPTLNTSGSTFVFGFKRRDDSVSTTTLRFEYGGNLSTWTSAAINASGGVSGNATVTINETGDPDIISVSIPKTQAVGGKLFGRLKVTSP